MNINIKTLTLSACAVALISSCTDLDVEMHKYEQFPDNDIAISGEFEGCYYYHRNEAWFGRNFWEGYFLGGDEAVGVNYAGSYDDAGRYRRPALHDFGTDVPGCGQWGEMQSGITYTNGRILLYGGAEGKDPIVAPLRAIRAYYHFWLMEIYGDIPILDHQLEEGEFVDRMPRAEVAKWIESELLEVIPDLNEANDISTYGRPNRWMAEALLAKLYLNWGVYTNPITEVTGTTANEKLNDCVAICDDIIKSGLFEVGKGYRMKFFPDNGDGKIKDFIYACPMDPATYGGAVYWAAHEMNRWFEFRSYGFLSPNTWGWTPTQTQAGNFVLTPECVDRFNLPGDERNIMIAVGPQYMFDENFEKTDIPINLYSDARHRKLIHQLNYSKEVDWVDLELFDVGSEGDLENFEKGARLYKYPPRQEDDLMWGRKQTNDIPVFRYADILLTKAECIMRGAQATNGDTPASLINEVRDCSSAPHVTGVPTMDELLDERGREFILEPWRRNDLIRFGKFENCGKWQVAASPKTMADKTKRLMPVPTDILNTNTNWSQNPGY